MIWGPLLKRRLSRFENAEGQTRAPARYARFGEFQLDLQRQELFKSGSRIKLQGKVFQALTVLLENPGEVVTRQAMSARLWADGSHVNFDANVNTTVNKLRQVLGDDTEQPAFVETVPRRGYSFIAKVEFGNDPLRENSGREGRRFSLFPVSGLSKSPSASSSGANMWLIIGILTLVVVGILFGAAIALYSRRVF